jgi:LAO/AO transport system kinase
MASKRSHPPAKTDAAKEVQAMAQAICRGETLALARGLTLMESRRPEHGKKAQKLLKELLRKTSANKTNINTNTDINNNTLRIGLSGPPGAGKSSLIELMGLEWIRRGKKVAVLAIDPSSPLSGGSLLGDKTRMQQLSAHPDCFIRPSSNRGILGGVAMQTRESILLCEAAGYDLIIVETVGVGQSEIAVAGIVDLFLMVTTPMGGDDLQGLKKGILETIDFLCINKADSGNEKLAKKARLQYEMAFHILFPEGGPITAPSLFECSALENKGVTEICTQIEKQQQLMIDQNLVEAKRQEQAVKWMWQLAENKILDRLYHKKELQVHAQAFSTAIIQGKMLPFEAAEKLSKIFDGQQ